MAGPCDHGGIHADIPSGDEAVRDMLALVRAVLRHDDEGQAAVLANADLQGLAQVLAIVLAALLMAAASQGETDPDAPPGPLTGEQLQVAEAILAAGIEGPGHDGRGWFDSEHPEPKGN